MNITSILVAVFSLVIFNPVPVSANETLDAVQQLKRLYNLLEAVEMGVERIDIARIYLMKEQCQKTQKSLEENGLGHSVTMREYQTLIVYFSHSFSFFKLILQTSNEKQIAEINEISKQIRIARGFDHSPYTKITYNVFSMQKRLFEQLVNSTEVPETLRRKMQALVPDIGRLLAVSDQGDHRLVYPPAIALHQQIVTLYEDFALIIRSDSAFYVTLEIQGLNEFYGEFAKISEAEQPEKP